MHEQICLTASLLTGSANPIEYMVHSGYFEKNNSGLKGEASYLAIKDRETFDKAFGVAFTMGKKPNVRPPDLQQSSLRGLRLIHQRG